MLAARYDTGAELGSGWRRTLRRRTSATGAVDLAIAEPVVIRIWGENGALDYDNRALTPVLEARGTVSHDHLEARLALSPEQVASLGAGEWEFAISVVDPETAVPETLCRGYFHVSGSVSDG